MNDKITEANGKQRVNRMRVSEKAPAKINLTLDVLGKREDGYHEVEMIMTTVDLADRIDIVERDDEKIVIDVSEGYIPNDERNLAYQAADLVKKTFAINKGVSISITKNIPVAAGLAGGSSDAAATLRGLNELWNLRLSTEELAELGAKIGSDVSFCVYGGTALVKGKGEIVEPISSPPPCWVVLAKPPLGVSTQEVYKRLNVNEIAHGDTSAMKKAIEEKNFQNICQNLHNALEPVTFRMHPEVEKIKEQMIRFGADGALMSGSGPTVFGLVAHESRLHRIYNGLRGFCQEVYAVRLLG